MVIADECHRAGGIVDIQKRWANQLAWSIAEFGIGEELVLYPLMEKYFGNHGSQVVRQDRDDMKVVSFSSRRDWVVFNLLLGHQGTPRSYVRNGSRIGRLRG